MKSAFSFLKNGRFLTHILFWAFAFLLLTYIYSTAFGSYRLGTVVVLMLLPVHMLYYYLLVHQVLPSFFKGRYLRTVVSGLAVMVLMAVLYRLAEIFVTDPYIYDFYIRDDPDFTWGKLAKSRWQQFISAGDFVNAVERSNVVVWIGLTSKLFMMWHERKNAILQAELSSLKGQLHPHFLFNSLNNIYALSLDNAPQTPGVVLGLSNILRYVIYECAADRVSLERDIEIMNDYIRLEQLRYEDRLDLNVRIEGEPPGRYRIAPLLMLPLLENAFKHGVGETAEGAWINMELLVRDGALHLKISNSKPEQPVPGRTEQSGGIGLSNVKNRLRLLYPEAHALAWYDEEECFIIELMVKLSAHDAA
ncbi:sensor histidine kinase [Chitinophaga rhizosphaerae]|uniref:sensor histidine kinase n=1 Tax=Chitinophaga rhizosphaerae TaxID=1864947 RepID=UPI000F802417|nr:histidine kinase [Chitinophaga rhizosphaerae]